jgi:hypothetical protein
VPPGNKNRVRRRRASTAPAPRYELRRVRRASAPWWAPRRRRAGAGRQALRPDATRPGRRPRTGQRARLLWAMKGLESNSRLKLALPTRVSSALPNAGKVRRLLARPHERAARREVGRHTAIHDPSSPVLGNARGATAASSWLAADIPWPDRGGEARRAPGLGRRLYPSPTSERAVAMPRWQTCTETFEPSATRANPAAANISPTIDGLRVRDYDRPPGDPPPLPRILALSKADPGCAPS